MSLLGGDLPGGVEQGVSDGLDGGRVGGGDSRSGEDGSLEALLAEAAGGDLRHPGGE